jgi:methyl-accepting chemotaxis protein
MEMRKRDKDMKKNYSLKRRFAVFFVLFIVAVYSVVIFTALRQIVMVTETLGIQMGLPIVEKAAGIIDGDAFEALSKSLDPQDPYYRKTQRGLWAIKKDSLAVYLYTMVPAEGSVFRYIIDGSALPGDAEAFSPLGAEEDISSYINPILKALETKTYQISSLDYSSEWGWLVSVYKPILNSSGEAVGIIGCDFIPEDLYTRLWSQIVTELIVAGIFALLGLAAYLYLANGINRQNRHLMELKDAAEASSRALQEERDKVVAMKDKLLAEMRALMELVKMDPATFDAFLEEAEKQFARMSGVLSNSAITRRALSEVQTLSSDLQIKTQALGLQTFSDRLSRLEEKIKTTGETVSPRDIAEIRTELERLIKAKNQSKDIFEKIQSYKVGDIRLRGAAPQSSQ